MDYLIFNSDGSIQKKKLTQYIQQGSYGVNQIFVVYPGALSTDVAQMVFSLPNHSNTTELGVYESNYEYDVDERANGFLFTLTTRETIYDGLVICALRVVRAANSILVHYPFSLIVNATGVKPDTDSGVTLGQLDSYLEFLEDTTTKSLRRLTYDASGKTVADLFTFVRQQTNNYPNPSMAILQINGITNSGAYMVLLAKTTNVDQYYLEFERYASGVRASQDRWVAAGISGSMTIEELLTTYNEYYVPYLVNGNRINYDTATMEQLHNAIGNVPHIIGLYGDSADASTYGGYFLIKFSEDSQQRLNFTALRISNHAQGYKDFYYGANIPVATLVSAVFNHSTSYYKPLEVASNKIQDINSQSTSEEYPSARAVYEFLDGDYQIYCLNTREAKPTSSTWTLAEYYRADGTKINTFADFESYVQGCGYANSYFEGNLDYELDFEYVIVEKKNKKFVLRAPIGDYPIFKVNDIIVCYDSSTSPIRRGGAVRRISLIEGTNVGFKTIQVGATQLVRYILKKSGSTDSFVLIGPRNLVRGTDPQGIDEAFNDQKLIKAERVYSISSSTTYTVHHDRFVKVVYDQNAVVIYTADGEGNLTPTTFDDSASVSVTEEYID